MQRAWGRKDLMAIDQRLLALESSGWKERMMLPEAWRPRQRPNHTGVTDLVTFWTLPWAYREAFSSFLSKGFYSMLQGQCWASTRCCCREICLTPPVFPASLIINNFTSIGFWALKEKISFWYLISSSLTTFPYSADGAWPFTCIKLASFFSAFSFPLSCWLSGKIF